MPDADRKRPRAARAAAELLIIFAGVSAAFFVEGYRESIDQRQRVRQATDGILGELGRYQVRNLEHADSIAARIDRWRAADAGGGQAVPGYYRIPGAPRPPTAAWDAAVSSGVVNMFSPELQMALGYFYSEFQGIHDNYRRHLEFVENEILPREEVGPSAFYDARGRLEPEFRVRMTLLKEFEADLRRLAEDAAYLDAWLRTGVPPAG